MVDLEIMDPMQTLLTLSRGKAVVTVTVCICILIAMLSAIAIMVKAAMLHKLKKDDSDLNLNVDAFHYLLVFLFYASSIIQNWSSQRTQRVPSHRSLCGELRNWLCSETESPSIPQTKPSSPTMPTVPTTSNTDLEMKGKEKEIAMITMKTRTSKLPKISETHIRSETASELFDDDIANNDRSKHPSPNNSVNHTLVSFTRYTTESKLELSPLDAPLNRINSNGEMLGKRGVPKPKRLKLKDRANAFRLSPIPNLEDAANKISERSLQSPPHRENRKHPKNITNLTEVSLDALNLQSHGISDRPTMERDDSHSHSEWMDGVLDGMHRRVNTVVFELENVLCTNSEALRGRSETELAAMTATKKELCLGGKERIQFVLDYLNAIHQRNHIELRRETSNSNESVKCFVVTSFDIASKAMLHYFKDLDLLKFFVSAEPRNPQKLISHIIGGDHLISKQCNGRKHLILLKLLQSLERSHDDMLFVGSNKKEIEHLDAIKVCKTYLVETSGLTEKAMMHIQSKYF